MEHGEPTIIKLKSGEDIIASISDITKTRMVLENPFTIETLTLIDQYGIPREERLLMKKWANWTKDHVISIPKNLIIDCMEPSSKATAHYLLVLRNGGIFKITKHEQTMLNESNAFMEDILEKIKNGDITPEMMEEGRADSEMMPEVPNNDPEQLPKKDNYGPNKNAKDFGNRPNDWSPDPTDYLS